MRNLGQQTERRILKELDARRQPRSGGIPGFPNDGIKGRYLIEVKSTQVGSLNIKREMVMSLEDNALGRDKIPALILVFNRKGEQDSLFTYREFVAIPREDFERLTKNWKKS